MSVPRVARIVAVFATALALACVSLAVRAAADDSDILVNVRVDGDTVLVAVDCPVHAPARVVWDVLTDYDRMAEFVSALESSRILSREHDHLRIYQKGRASRGILSIAFENVREIDLVPRHEIHSRLVSGDLKESEFSTLVGDEDGVVHVRNSGRFVPKLWVPPIIGPALIAAETRKQFAEIRAEILRRSEPVAGAAR